MNIVPQIFFGDVTLIAYNGKKQDKIIPINDVESVFTITVLNIIDVQSPKENGHKIEIKVQGGFCKKGTNDVLLIVESVSKSFISPYLLTFSQRPASDPFIDLVTVSCMSAVKNNIGMIAVLKKKFSLDNLILNEMKIADVRKQVVIQLNRATSN
jgi:hypothetical protein